jgi:hypothetical protein
MVMLLFTSPIGRGRIASKMRIRVRGYASSMDRNPSPGFLAMLEIRPLPMGEVKKGELQR